MIEFLQNIFATFSFMEKYTGINESVNPAAVPIIFLFFIGIFLVSNIIYFLGSWDSDEYNFWIYIAGIIVYLIINTIFLTIFSLISVSIFHVYGLSILAAIFLTRSIVTAFEYEDEVENASIFNIMPKTKFYVEILTQFLRYKKESKKTYNKFLNLKY